MTDDEYRMNMDAVLQALATATAVTRHISDADLRLMDETLRRADAVGFIFVKPLTLRRQDSALRLQAEALELLKNVRAFIHRAKEAIDER